MTTTKINLQEIGTRIVGRQQISTTEYVAGNSTYCWTVFKTTHDVWWEECPRCYSASGTLPEFMGVFGGVCFKCGGTGAHRIAGSTIALERKIRSRISSRTSSATRREREAEALRSSADAWSVEHPNVASDLARTLAEGDNSVLARLALTLQERPLSVRQCEFATRLLRERAYVEAYATSEPLRTWIGNVGEKVNATGRVTVAHYLSSERYDRSDSMLIVIEVPQADDSVAYLKMTTGARWAFNVEKGDTINISGLVVDHVETDMFGKQTIIKRPTWKD